MKRRLDEETPQQLFATHFPSVRYLPASPARRLAGAAGSHCLWEGRRDQLPVSQFLAHLRERGRVPPSGTTGIEPSPPIFECSCPVAGCPDRTAMQGPSPPPRMALLGAKGWGLCATGDIPAGAFVCDYRGEALSASEAAARHSSYELAGLQHTFLLCVRESFGARVNVTAIDATHAGSEGRCINHSCRPNLVLELVRTHQPLAPIAAPPAADGATVPAAERSQSGVGASVAAGGVGTEGSDAGLASHAAVAERSQSGVGASVAAGGVGTEGGAASHAAVAERSQSGVGASAAGRGVRTEGAEGGEGAFQEEDGPNGDGASMGPHHPRTAVRDARPPDRAEPPPPPPPPLPPPPPPPSPLDAAAWSP